MQAGELIVVGKDKAHIPLHQFPYDVKVHFKEGDDCLVPCNPHHADSLEWEVLTAHHEHHSHGGYVLVIKWEVTNVREIVWKVFY